MKYQAQFILQKLRKYREKKFIHNFNFRNDDIVIVTYPRSGTTWLRFIFANLIKDIRDDLKHYDKVNFKNIDQIVPALSLLRKEAGFNYDELGSPRVLTTHISQRIDLPKVVYLVRDCRDVLISFYYYLKKINAFKGTLYDFINNDREKEQISWWHDHLNSWVFKNSNLNNLYLLKYENLLFDTHKEIKELTEFINIQVTSKQIDYALNESSFKNMQKIENTSGLNETLEKGDSNIPFVRKGRSEQWKEEINEETKEIIKKKYGTMLIKTGYESSFRW